jgi:hypothetical protein
MSEDYEKRVDCTRYNNEGHRYLIHDWKYGKTRKATGKNLLGKVVTSRGRDMRCARCNAISWQLVSPDVRYVPKKE